MRLQAQRERGERGWRVVLAVRMLRALHGRGTHTRAQQVRQQLQPIRGVEWVIVQRWPTVAAPILSNDQGLQVVCNGGQILQAPPWQGVSLLIALLVSSMLYTNLRGVGAVCSNSWNWNSQSKWVAERTPVVY